MENTAIQSDKKDLIILRGYYLAGHREKRSKRRAKGREIRAIIREEFVKTEKPRREEEKQTDRLQLGRGAASETRAWLGDGAQLGDYK